MSEELFHSVDYVTEREARAIRGAFDLPGHERYNPEDMTISIRDRRGVVTVPANLAVRRRYPRALLAPVAALGGGDA